MEDEQRPPEHPYPSPQESLPTSPTERCLVRPVRKMQIVSRFRALACRNPPPKTRCVPPGNRESHDLHRRTKGNPTPCPTWCGRSLGARVIFSALGLSAMEDEQRPPEHPYPSPQESLPTSPTERCLVRPVRKMQIVPISCARVPQPSTQNEVRPARKPRVTRPTSEDEREPDPMSDMVSRSLGARVIFSALGLSTMEDEQRPPEHPYPSPQESLSTSPTEHRLVRPVRKMQIVSRFRALACRNPPPKTRCVPPGNRESHDLHRRTKGNPTPCPTWCGLLGCASHFLCAGLEYHGG